MKKIISRLLVFCFICLTACQENASTGTGSDVIDRHPDRLIYTKHARCRMDCRHIDEAEVQEILQEGRINYRKSEPAGRPDPKYALEGTTRDGQQVRIVFAPAKRGMVVITVIDLRTEWSCDCK
jgi:predicted small secreted protein